MSYIVLLFLSAQFAHASTPPAIITEIGAQEASDYEWVEIYNQSDAPVDLTSWKFFEENTRHGLKADQQDLIIDPKEYAIIANVPAKFLEHHPTFTGTVIDSSWSSLKESGELIGLVDSNGVHVDEFTYSPVTSTSIQRVLPDSADVIQWIAHATGDSAGRANEFESANASNADPITADPANTENGTDVTPPLSDSISTDLTNAGNQSQTSSTAGEATAAAGVTSVATEETATSNNATTQNEALQTQTETAEAQNTDASSVSVVQKSAPVSFGGTATTLTIKKPKATKKKAEPTLLLSEIFPNPYGSDAIYEFIEIQNVSSSVQPMSGWMIKSKSGSFNLPDSTIQPHEFKAFLRTQTNLALNNQRDAVQLIDPAGKKIDEFKYAATVEENNSFQRFTGDWRLSRVPSRGGENFYVAINTAPEFSARCFRDADDSTQLVCDASDSFDADSDVLSFMWILQNKNDEPVIRWDGDYFSEPYATFKNMTLELTISDGQKKITKKVKIPRTEEAVMSIQAVRTVLHENMKTKKQENKKTSAKKTTVKKRKAKKPAIATNATIHGLVILEPDKDRKQMYVEFPGIKILSPRGRLPAVKLGDEITARGKLSADKSSLTIAAEQDVTIEATNAPPQPIVVPDGESLSRYAHALVQIKGTASGIYGTGFQISQGDLRIPVYIPPALKTSSDRFADQEVSVAGIVKMYRGKSEIVPRTVEDIEITSPQITVPRHEAANALLSIWHDWRVGTTLLVCSLIGLMGWRVRRLVPAPVRVDATVAGTDMIKRPKQMSNRRPATFDAAQES